ncbi:hypothetical protein [Lactiplantibacillus plantarum]|nr:hypothetical protein [Lactiplantibacillus plantarum]
MGTGHASKSEMAVGVASGFASTGAQWMYGTTTPHEVCTVKYAYVIFPRWR